MLFSTPAQDALSISNPMFRTRPLVLASRDAKLKARQCQEFLMPSKPRPETSVATARRLVSGALGLKSNVSKEQRAAERQKIKDARGTELSCRDFPHLKFLDPFQSWDFVVFL